jgi:hypothetical protein
MCNTKTLVKNDAPSWDTWWQTETWYAHDITLPVTL